MLTVTERVRTLYPGARMGILAVENVINPPSHNELEREKAGLEERLRRQYGDVRRETLITLPSIQPYAAHYRGFKKTYHVLLQLESVVHKGRSLPKVAALVEAMFMAELKTQLLTAGHDLDALEGELILDAAVGGEPCPLIGGQEAAAKENDMIVRDGLGIVSSIIYGPDFRTRIKETTRRAIFTVYAPEGITAQMLSDHLDGLERNIRVISPRAVVLKKQIYP